MPPIRDAIPTPAQETRPAQQAAPVGPGNYRKCPPINGRPSGLPNGRLRTLNKPFPYADYLCDPAGRFMLCAIPKNGCTAMKRWLLSANEPGISSDLLVHKRCRDGYSLALTPPAGRQAVLAQRPCFAFVREPLARLASAFADKFVRLAPVGYFEGARELMEEHARRSGINVELDTFAPVELAGRTLQVASSSRVDYARGLTFREFVGLVCDLPDEALDPHWRPQTSYLSVLPGVDRGDATVDDSASLVISPLHRLAEVLNGLSSRFNLAAVRVEDRLRATGDQAAPVQSGSAAEQQSGQPSGGPGELGLGRLADVPSGTLARTYWQASEIRESVGGPIGDARGQLPTAPDLFDTDLTALATARFEPDAALWRSVLQQEAPASPQRGSGPDRS